MRLGHLSIRSHKAKARSTSFAMTNGMIQFLGLMALAVAFLSIILVKVNSANASFGYDVPEILKISAVSPQDDAILSYPMVLGSTERSSSRLSAFTKWSGMFQRFESQVENGRANQELNILKADLKHVQDVPLIEKAAFVNKYMNERPYVSDNRNWGQSDYWETPVEFLQRGGDCEDFAIAKYTALRMLGVSDQRLRIAVVKDTWKNVAHAVLIVYTNNGPYVLDNQTKGLMSATYADRYEPIFSINRQAWWLHKAADTSRVASAY